MSTALLPGRPCSCTCRVGSEQWGFCGLQAALVSSTAASVTISASWGSPLPGPEGSGSRSTDHVCSVVRQIPTSGPGGGPGGGALQHPLRHLSATGRSRGNGVGEGCTHSSDSRPCPRDYNLSSEPTRKRWLREKRELLRSDTNSNHSIVVEFLRLNVCL